MLSESSGSKDWENGEGRGTGPERTGKELRVSLAASHPHPNKLLLLLRSGGEGPNKSSVFQPSLGPAHLGPAHHMCTCSSEARSVWVDSSPGEGCRRLLVEGRRGAEENRGPSPGQPGKPLEKLEAV